MGFHLARQARPTWANRPYQSSYCWPTPEWGRSRHSHLCKTLDFWSGEAIFAFEQLCARNCRCWRCLAAECKRRSRAAAQRERTRASKPMTHVLPYIPLNAKLQSPHPPNSISADRIHGDITLVAPKWSCPIRRKPPGAAFEFKSNKKSANPEGVRTLLFWCRRRDLNPHTRNVGTSTSSLRVCRSTTPTLGC